MYATEKSEKSIDSKALIRATMASVFELKKMNCVCLCNKH